MIKKLIIQKYPRINFSLLKRRPLLFLYSIYLTWRYIDEYNIWPALHFNSYVRVKFVKEKASFIRINTKLIIEQWLNTNKPIIIKLSPNAKLNIENDFILGPNITLFLSSNARLNIKGKKVESGSGITANSIIMVNEFVELGSDCLIAWDTYITDCDWHYIEGKKNCKPTIIEDHCWIGVGAKVLKGVRIEKNCVVTSNTVVVSGCYKANSLMFGNPLQVKVNAAPIWKRDMC
jgi:acetyltransferase-like isoleucine patch superfamily enzyme